VSSSKVARRFNSSRMRELSVTSATHAIAPLIVPSSCVSARRLMLQKRNSSVDGSRSSTSTSE